MKKLLTPFLYFTSAVPVFLGILLPTIVVYGFFEQFYDVRGLEFILGLILFLTWGTVCFWGMNRALIDIEGLQKPSFLDHFRQSLFYYLFLPLAYWAITPFYGGLAQGYALVILAAAGWAILLNIVHLTRLHIINRPKTPEINAP